MTGRVFDEMALQEDIENQWGPEGAHMEIYDALLRVLEAARAVDSGIGKIEEDAYAAPEIVKVVPLSGAQIRLFNDLIATVRPDGE